MRSSRSHPERPHPSAPQSLRFSDGGGLGFSDPGEHPSDLLNNADDLERLIKAAGFETPVLVGHSLGGLYVSYYARTRPGQVAGLVLVDPSTFSQRAAYLKFLGQEVVAKQDAGHLEQIAHYRRCLELARAGELVPGRAGAAPCLDDPPLEDPVLHAETDRQLARPQTPAATLSEYLSFYGEATAGPALDKTQWSAAPSPVGVPVILLRRTYGKPSSVSQAAYDGIVAAAVAEFADLAPHPSGRVVTVANTGHQIQLDQPQAVIDAVREVVGRSRR